MGDASVFYFMCFKLFKKIFFMKSLMLKSIENDAQFHTKRGIFGVNCKWAEPFKTFHFRNVEEIDD